MEVDLKKILVYLHTKRVATLLTLDESQLGIPWFICHWDDVGNILQAMRSQYLRAGFLAYEYLQTRAQRNGLMSVKAAISTQLLSFGGTGISFLLSQLPEVLIPGIVILSPGVIAANDFSPFAAPCLKVGSILEIVPAPQDTSPVAMFYCQGGAQAIWEFHQTA